MNFKEHFNVSVYSRHSLFKNIMKKLILLRLWFKKEVDSLRIKLQEIFRSRRRS